MQGHRPFFKPVSHTNLSEVRGAEYHISLDCACCEIVRSGAVNARNHSAGVPLHSVHRHPDASSTIRAVPFTSPLLLQGSNRFELVQGAERGHPVRNGLSSGLPAEPKKTRKRQRDRLFRHHTQPLSHIYSHVRMSAFPSLQNSDAGLGAAFHPSEG